MKYIYILLLALTSICVNAVELKQVEILDGKISIQAPDNFAPMQKKLLEIKYPNSNRPQEVLSNTSGTVSLAFSHTPKLITEAQLSEAAKQMSKGLHNLYPSATWFRDEIIELKGRKFLVLELTTPALDTQIHNIMYATSVDGRLLLASFNTTVEEEDEWLPIGKQIMESIAIN